MNLFSLPVNTTWLSDWWATVLLHSLWLGAAMAFFVAFMLSAFRVRASNTRYLIALAGLLMIPAGSIIAARDFPMPDLPGLNAAPNRSAEPTASDDPATPNFSSQSVSSPKVAATRVTNERASGHSSSEISVRRLVTAIWLVGTACMLLRLTRSHLSARRLATHSTVETPAWLQMLFCEVKREIGVVREVSLLIGETVGVPMVYGVLAPVVLLPASFVTGLSLESLRIVVAHELAHVRRHDLLFGFIERLVEAVFFFHPAVWWLLRQVQNEREVACDSMVAGLTGQRLQVASALVDSAEAVAGRRPEFGHNDVAMAVSDGWLEDRVERLINPAKPPRSHITLVSLGGLVSLGVIGLLCLTAGTASVAVQVAEALSPQAQVEAVAEAREKAAPPDFSATPESEQTITGRVVGPPDLDLRRVILDLYVIRRGQTDHISTSIERDGRFTKEVRSPASVYVTTRMPGFAVETFGPFEVTDQSVDIGQFKLDPGFSASLRILDPAGQPLPGAELKGMWINPTWKTVNPTEPRPVMGVWISNEFKSDADGILRIDHLCEQIREFRVEKAGYQFDGRRLRLTEGDVVDWKLSPCDAARGRLVDSNGRAAAGVELHLVHRDGPYATSADPRSRYLQTYGGAKPSPIVTTDADGRFAMNTLRSDTTYAVMTLSPDFQPVILNDIAVGKDLGTITLPPPIVVSGQLKGDLMQLHKRYDADTRTFHYRNAIQMPGGSGYDASLQAEVDNDGRFSVRQIYHSQLSLYPGGRQIVLKAGMSKTDIEVDLDAPADDAEKDYRPLKFVFKSPSDRPVVGKVHLSWRVPEDSEYVGKPYAAKRLLLVGNRDADTDSTAEPKTDRSGMELTVVRGNEFVWAGPPGAKIYFSAIDLVGSMAKSQWLGEIPEGDGPHEIQIPIEPAGLLTGRFLDERGKPVTDFKISIRGTRLDQMPFAQYETIHHVNGQFAIGPLPLGAGHQFQAFVTGTKRWGFGISESFEINAANPVVDFDVRLTPSVNLSGTVVDASGAPLSKVPISLGVATGRWRDVLGQDEFTDAEGRFRVPVSVPEVEGEFTLRIRPQTNHAGRAVIVSPIDAIYGVDFGEVRVGPASTISGKVVDENGVPVSRVYVSMKPRVHLESDYPQGLTERTDKDGRFMLVGVEQRPQQIHVIGDGRLIDVSHPFQKSADADEAYLEDPAEIAEDITIVVRRK